MVIHCFKRLHNRSSNMADEQSENTEFEQVDLIDRID